MGDTAYRRWTRADEPAAPGGLGMGSVLLALSAAALLSMMIYGSFYQWRVLRSWYAARQLVAAEEAAAKATVGVDATATQQPKPTSGAGPGKGPTVTRRVCRLCDVVVDDAHIQSHLGGKKHTKLAASQKLIGADGLLVPASSVCCWAYTEFRVEPVLEAPAPEEQLPAPTASHAGGRGRWEEVPGKDKGVGGAARRNTKSKGAW